MGENTKLLISHYVTNSVSNYIPLFFEKENNPNNNFFNDIFLKRQLRKLSYRAFNQNMEWLPNIWNKNMSGKETTIWICLISGLNVLFGCNLLHDMLYIKTFQLKRLRENTKYCRLKLLFLEICRFGSLDKVLFLSIRFSTLSQYVCLQLSSFLIFYTSFSFSCTCILGSVL